MDRLLLKLAAVSALALSSSAISQQVVPSDPGNAQGPAPLRYFGGGGSRVQQIYSPTYFSGVQTINAISFRAYPGSAPSFFFGNTVSASNITITAGTSTASGNDTSGLASATFANNIFNSQIVYTGALTLTTAATGSGAQPFDYTINFMNPFLYDPSGGSLILDFLIPSSATVSGNGFGFLTFDTANTENDGVFSVVDIFNGDATSGSLSTAGAITQFTTSQIAAVPEPSTWAMMLLGFGAIGVATRRRKRLTGARQMA